MRKKPKGKLPLLPAEPATRKREKAKQFAAPVKKRPPVKRKTAPVKRKRPPVKRKTAPVKRKTALGWSSRVRLAKARWYVQRTSFEGQQVRREGEIELAPFNGPTAYVGARYKSVIGVPGSFSSETVEVSLSMPCYPAEVDGMADAVTDWCARRIVQERDELVSYIGLRAGEGSTSGSKDVPH